MSVRVPVYLKQPELHGCMVVKVRELLRSQARVRKVNQRLVKSPCLPALERRSGEGSTGQGVQA